MGKATVLGSSNTDFVVQAPQLPMPGQTVLGARYFQAAGGKGANQAVAAKRAGADVLFLTSFGDDDLGAKAKADLESQGLDLRFAKTVPHETSGVALIVVDSVGQNQIAVCLGANARFAPADVDALPDDVFPQDAVFVAQLEIPVDTVRAALRRASNKGMTVVFNPAPPVSGLADCVALVDVLVVNEHEASVILGENWGLESTEELESASDRLLQLGCRHVIVTLGERGYALRTAGLPMRLFPGVKVSAIDAVAAGDAFVGALASALSEGTPIEPAAAWANRAAAISVTRAGAQPSLPFRSEIDAFDG